jgi:pimeloyl-ACP methyl ester carboxylesterase
MKRWSDSHWTSRDGLKLHYRDYAGPDTRPPLLCLHGLTRNARDFEALAEHFAGDWRVIAPDFRGRGGSEHDPVPANYTPPTYAVDVVELLDELAIPEAVFIGTSLGGLVTMAVATFAGDRIAGAVLNDVGPELDPAGVERIRTYVGKLVLFRCWEEAARAFQEKFGHVHPRYGAAEWLGYAKRVCRETDRGVELDYDMAIAEPFSTMNAEAAPDAWPLLGFTAGRPVLILRGESSDLLSQPVAERMREEIPGAELVTVPDVGHAPDFDEPETVAAVDRLLQRVLADLPRRSAA